MTFDTRWERITKDWLWDSNVPEGLIEKHWRVLAQRLQDTAEEAPGEIADLEREAEQAAYDAHINRLLDEARGK